MEDPEIVAAIVFGDPDGLAEAYDRYAVPLYAYCCSMLREPADAADAVQDTFLIAAAKLRGLRDPSKLRPWLYAVARNECLRRLRSGHATAALEEAGDVPTESAGVGREAERADLHELLRDAIDGLNPGERDVIELSLSHELEGDDLADVLGVSRNHAHALLSRARSQLERSLGALIVARTGRQACPGLDAMLAGWDGQLTVLMRKRISRHIEQCESCGDRKRRELTPALFAGIAPLVAVLPGFRDQLLRSMADRTPAGTAARLSAADHAGRFGPSGFPKPLRAPGTSAWHQAMRHPHVPLHHSNAVVASAATSVMAAGAIAVVVIGGPHGPSAAAGARDGTTHSAATSTGGPWPAHDGPAGRSEAGLVPSTSGSTGPTPGAPNAAATSSSPSSPTGSSPAAATAPSVATSTSSGSSATPTVSQGTLTISTGTLDLATVNGTASGKLTITAKGGPVSDYSITVGSALAGKLTVSPSSGSLAAGASATVTVTSTSLIALDGQLTVNPGGQTVTVVLSVGL
jgi:RNA polymerase sigma factor (sigma-70 family)